MKQKLLQRFLKYISYDTQSAFEAKDIPSTEKQKLLAEFLFKELTALGLNDIFLDDNSYLYARLPANIDKNVPKIGFISHLDTSPDFSGENVKAKIWNNYDGKDLKLNDKITLKTSDFPEILNYKGQTIITTDGTTLLGADDKAGIAEIITAIEYLIENPQIEHGEINIAFTPDEEVGRGADLFDVARFGADWAYTIDGSELGELEYENFNAAFARITTNGRSVHPGYAKNKMINSMLIAAEFIEAMPKNQTPETTEKYEGFFHLTSIKGEIEQTTLDYIIRDHDKQKFQKRKDFLIQETEKLKKKHGDDFIEISIKDQYYNMREKVEEKLFVVELVEKCMRELNIEPKIKPIRGGTDGSRLSFMGLICPNIFTGGHNFHGKYEYAVLETMEKTSKLIVEIAKKIAQ